MMEDKETIAYRYHQIMKRIESSAQKAGRKSESVKMLVVTKGQPIERIIQVFEAGARRIGENYPDETAEKLEKLQVLPGLEIHMIGHLQSRKARIVAGSFSYMHSLDRISIAEKLDRELVEVKQSLPVLLEMNVSGEESKQGFPAWNKSQWEELLPVITQMAVYRSLKISGLMTMPPLSVDPSEIRPYFQKLRELRDYLAVQFSEINWSELSMGTSADFETAVQEGATFIRVGTAIMGPRPPKNSLI